MLRSTALAAVLLLLVTAPSLAAGGTFRGASGHATSGSVTVTQQALAITQVDEYHAAVIATTLDGAPDPYVSLGNRSRPVKGGTAGVLRRLKGAGTYSVPAPSATRNAKQVVIWCRKYAVPLGVARLR